MRCSTCFHELTFHFDEGCCYQQNGNICPCTVAFALPSSPPRVPSAPSAPSVPEESTVPVSPPQTCVYCGHATIAHGPLGNCLACVPGREGHDCRAVLVREFVHAARTKYERLEVELGQALDELAAARKEIVALKDQKEKARWHIERATSHLDEALEDLPIDEGSVA